MQFKVLNKTENPLLKRKEVVVEIVSESAPNYKNIEEYVCKEFSVKSDSVKIKKVVGDFGKKLFKVMINIYHSKKDLDSAESRTKKERVAETKAIEEAKKAEEKPAEGEGK